MTLTFGSWVGIPAVPFVTIYKAEQPELAQLAGLGVVNPSVRLSCLPLWCVLRSLGKDQVRARVRGVFAMLEEVTARLEALPCLRLLRSVPGGQGLANPPLQSDRGEERCEGGCAGGGFPAPRGGRSTTSSSPSSPQVFHTVSPALAFQYVSESPPDLSGR
jgi:hypothetical protein